MYQSTIDMWISRYISSGVDVTDLNDIQTRLKDDLREDVPHNLLSASVHRVTRIREELNEPN